MPPPRVFRHLARSMTRSQLADRDAVPIIMDGVRRETALDGLPLRALFTEASITVQMPGGGIGIVDRQIVTYNVADLPREPRKGDRVVVSGKPTAIAETKVTRVGLIDCFLQG